MHEHKRWLCRECKREWHDVMQTNANGGNYINSYPVTVTGNPLGNNCPFCGSPEIVEIVYKPRFPGLDIPRNGEFRELPRRKILAVLPGQVSTGNVTIEANQQQSSPQLSTPPEPIKPEVKKPPLTIGDIIRSEEVQVKSSQPTGPGNAITKEMMENFSSIYDLSDMD